MSRVLARLQRLDHCGVLTATRFRQTFTRDAVQPGADGRLSLESAEAAIRPNEHVLRQVARVFVVADEAIAELVDVALVPLDEHIERGHLPGPARLDQRAVDPPRPTPASNRSSFSKFSERGSVTAQRGVLPDPGALKSEDG